MRARVRELEGRLGAVEEEKGELERTKGELERENHLIKALLPPLSPAAQALISLAAGTPGGLPGTGRAVQTPPAVRARPRVSWADEEGGDLVDELGPEPEPEEGPEAAHFEPFPELEPEPEPEPEPPAAAPAWPNCPSKSLLPPTPAPPRPGA